MNKSYKENKDIGNAGEHAVINTLKSMGHTIEFHTECGDNFSKYDLVIKHCKTGKYIKIEVKTEEVDSNNAFIELVQSLEMSGLALSEAEYYISFRPMTRSMYCIRTDKLKNYIMNKRLYAVQNKSKTEFWNLTLGFLVPLSEFTKCELES